MSVEGALGNVAEVLQICCRSDRQWWRLVLDLLDSWCAGGRLQPQIGTGGCWGHRWRGGIGTVEMNHGYSSRGRSPSAAHKGGRHFSPAAGKCYCGNQCTNFGFVCRSTNWTHDLEFYHSGLNNTARPSYMKVNDTCTNSGPSWYLPLYWLLDGA